VPTTVAVLSNDGDPDGDDGDLRIRDASLISGDARIEVGTNTIVFDADPEYLGDVVVDYTIEDLDGLTATARAILTVVEGPNRPPSPGDDATQVANGGTVSVPIALNDSDPDGDALTYSIVSFPDGGLGTAELDLNSLVFTAVPGASGVATIVYRVDDGELTSDANVSITVLPCAESAPDAPDLFLQTGYQQPIAIDLTVTASNGVVTDVGPPLSAPTGVYTPPAGENGNVSFSYAVRNSCRIQDVGQVVIDVNQDPIASPYEDTIGRLSTAVIPVSSLATDAEPLVIVALEGAPEWVSIIDEQRAILVDPQGRSGRLDMSAIVADPGGLQTRVPITIQLVNNPPVAQPDAVAVADDVVTFSPLVNDGDPDGDPVSLASVPATLTFANGEVGTIERLSDDQLRIDAGAGLGVAVFDYTIVDSFDLISAPATVTVTVNRSPIAPNVDIVVVAGDDVEVAVPATDAEGGPLTLTILDDPSPLTIDVDGLTVTVIAPTSAANQEFDITYRVTDPQGASATGRLKISVDPPIPPPTTTTTTTTVPATTTVPPPPTTAPTPTLVLNPTTTIRPSP
jgi:hypothetical protein